MQVNKWLEKTASMTTKKTFVYIQIRMTNPFDFPGTAPILTLMSCVLETSEHRVNQDSYLLVFLWVDIP